MRSAPTLLQTISLCRSSSSHMMEVLFHYTFLCVVTCVLLRLLPFSIARPALIALRVINTSAGLSYKEVIPLSLAASLYCVYVPSFQHLIPPRATWALSLFSTTGAELALIEPEQELQTNTRPIYAIYHLYPTSRCVVARAPST